MATVNNNWPTPVATDLVKDGWEAIKDLGDAIDTTLGVYADPGLVLLNTTSFSGVASQSVSNVFTDDFQDYRVIFSYLANTGTPALTMRLINSSGPITSSNYNFVISTVDSANGLFGNLINGQSQSSIGLATSSDTNTRKYIFDISNTRIADTTNLTGFRNANFGNINAFAASLLLTDIISGFQIITASGTITGVAKVYGYNA